MGKQVLYIITGLPYSGKSTLTKELVRRLDLDTASVDEYLDKGKYVVEKMVQDDWNQVYSQALNKLEKLLTEGKSVVFDGASLKKFERDTLKGIAEKLGVLSKLIYIKTDINEIKSRQLKNKQLKTRGHIKNTTLNKAIKMFEEPGANENALVYEYPADLNDWIKKNLI